MKTMQEQRQAPRARKTIKQNGASPESAGSQTLSLKEQAYQLIKHRIITCAFKPGESLNEAAVAAALNLGRTPVHQAFERLRLEALVDILPRKGIVVREIGLEEVLQLSEARILNEPHVARLAAERATTSEIAQMRDALTESVSDSVGLERYIMLDREFHLLIAKAAKSEVLYDILLNLNERSLRLWSISLADTKHRDSVNDEHRAIFLAICERNGDDADNAMRQHIVSFRRMMIDKLSKLQSF